MQSKIRINFQKSAQNWILEWIQFSSNSHFSKSMWDEVKYIKVMIANHFSIYIKLLCSQLMRWNVHPGNKNFLHFFLSFFIPNYSHYAIYVIISAQLILKSKISSIFFALFIITKCFWAISVCFWIVEWPNQWIFYFFLFSVIYANFFASLKIMRLDLGI